MKAFGSVYGYVAKSGLPADLLDLVFLRAFQIDGCAHCARMHSLDAQKHGASLNKLLPRATWHENGAAYTDRKRAPLA